MQKNPNLELDKFNYLYKITFYKYERYKINLYQQSLDEKDKNVLVLNLYNYI